MLFNPEVNFDESKNLYTIAIKNLDVVATGDTLEDAVDMFLDKIDFLALTYFENREIYIKTENYQDYYDYFLGISRCTKNELMGMLAITH